MIVYRLTFTTTTGRSVSAIFESREQAKNALNLFLLQDEMVDEYKIEDIQHESVPEYALRPNSN